MVAPYIGKKPKVIRPVPLSELREIYGHQDNNEGLQTLLLCVERGWVTVDLVEGGEHWLQVTEAGRKAREDGTMDRL